MPQPCSCSKKKHFLWTLFLGHLWVTVLLCSCEWQGPKTTVLLKTMKTSKDQEKIHACALQNGCSKIWKVLGKSLCRSPVLEMLSCIFIKTGLHRWHFSRKLPTFWANQFHRNTSERLIGKGVLLFSKLSYYCFGRSTVEV